MNGSNVFSAGGLKRLQARPNAPFNLRHSSSQEGSTYCEKLIRLQVVGSAWVENPHRHKQASMAYIKLHERNGSTIPVTGEAKCWKGASELSARTRLNLFCGLSSCTNRSSCSCFSQRRLRMNTRTPEATTTQAAAVAITATRLRLIPRASSMAPQTRALLPSGQCDKTFDG